MTDEKPTLVERVPLWMAGKVIALMDVDYENHKFTGKFDQNVEDVVRDAFGNDLYGLSFYGHVAPLDRETQKKRFDDFLRNNPDVSEDSNLVKHADIELRAAGLFDEDSDYNGETGKAVLNLIKLFASQGHSGFSASLVLNLFSQLARYENLTPLSNNPEEWTFVAPEVWGSEGGVWQSKRNSEAFSNDGGKTYYLLSEGGNDKNREPLHTSIDYKKEDND